jgi:hypothetical protein
MNFIKKIFGAKNKPIESYTDFWEWFKKNENDFYNVVNKGTNFENKPNRLLFVGFCFYFLC